MFDEDKINELLRGASQKKKSSSSTKKTANNRIKKEESVQSTEQLLPPNPGCDLTSVSLQEIGAMMGSGSRIENERQRTQPKEKPVSINNIQKRQDYIHERKLAEDRLVRLKKAEKRIDELEKERRTLLTKVNEEQESLDRQKHQELERKIAGFITKIASAESIISQQKEQIQSLLHEKELLEHRCVDLQTNSQTVIHNQQESKEITQVFQEHGLQSEEYRDVMAWLLHTGIFPLSYLQTQHFPLLRQILSDKCHIQASNLPLPKESNDIYIDVSLERCPLSGGQDIVEQARLFKDECLIYGYTTIVMFGTQGIHEPLFQVLFAHHALRVTLSPSINTLSSEDIHQQIQSNQLSFSWGEAGEFAVDYTSSNSTVGGFLHELVSYLRSMS